MKRLITILMSWLVVGLVDAFVYDMNFFEFFVMIYLTQIHFEVMD